MIRTQHEDTGRITEIPDGSLIPRRWFMIPKEKFYMLQQFMSQHWNDENGNPGGGISDGLGITVSWQNGTLGRGTERREPNGAFVETVIAIAADRLKYYQASKFNCKANADAISHLEAALAVLEERTKERESRNVEGTHTV